MNRFNISFALLAFFLCFNISAQQTYHFTIDWDNRLPDSLSVYYNNIMLNDNELMESAEILNVTSILCPDDEKFSFITNDNIGFKSSFGSYNGKSSCDFTLIPFYTDENSKIYLVTSFDILIKTTSKHQRKSANKSGSSILASGDWYKYNVYESGIYYLTPSDLSINNISTDNLKIDNIRIFAKEGYILDELITDELTENPKQIPVIVEDNNNDSFFNGDDKILFYIEGPHSWSYKPEYNTFRLNYNQYTDTSSFFLNISNDHSQLIMPVFDSIYDHYDEIPYAVTQMFYYKNELSNLVHSGHTWFGETSTKTDSIFTIPVQFEISELPEENTTNSGIYISVAANSSARSYIYPRLDNKTSGIKTIQIARMTDNYAVANQKDGFFQFLNTSKSPKIDIVYTTDALSADYWLERVEASLRSKISFIGKQFTFFHPFSSEYSEITRYSFTNTSNDFRVLNISNPLSPILMKNISDDDHYVFDYRVNHTTPEEFIAFDDNCLMKPNYSQKIANQDLLSLPLNIDYLILTPSEFISEAELFGLLHEQYDGYTYKVVTLEQIYNEFTCGQQDVTAIRDFIRRLYVLSNQEYPRYVQLIGGTSYDYKNIVVKDKNMFPTYQCEESLSRTDSYGTDDYYIILDEDEGDDAKGIGDIPLGRIPFNTKIEIENTYKKIRHYIEDRNSPNGLWRHQYVLSADDDSKAYINYQEQISNIYDTTIELFNIKKLYIDSYKQERTLTGYSCPEATKELLRILNEGALLLSYFGHGSKLGWAAENFLDIPTIQKIDNYDNMPFILASTCEFFEFDNPGLTPAGQLLLGHNKGGTYSIVSTTRLSLTDINRQFQKNYSSYITSESLNNDASIGKIFMAGKQMSSIYSRNILLFGDPALKLNYPNYQIVIDSINNISTNSEDFSCVNIPSLDIVTIQGHITNGKKTSNFNGYLEYQLFGTPSHYSTLNNEEIGVVDYQMRDKILNKGKVRVSEGAFSIQFRLTEDDNAGDETMKLDMYAYDTVIENVAGGTFKQLKTLGVNDSYRDDNGPNISGYINSSIFKDGDIIPENSILYLYFDDESGIYSSNHIIGNDITMVINDMTQNTISLNSLFRPTANDYRSGTIQYKLAGLTPGSYTLHIKCYDICGNNSDFSVSFSVSESIIPKISQMQNIPNPVKDNTSFVFFHNLNNNFVDVEIDIFDISGRRISTIKKQDIICEPNKRITINCDNNDIDFESLSDGIYPYRLKLTTKTGNSIVSSNKIMIVK